MAFLMGEGLGTQAQGGLCVHRDSTGPCGRAAPRPKLAGAGCRGRGRLLTRPLLPCRPRRPWPRWRWQTQSETASPPWALAARRSCGAAAGPAQQPRARRPQPPSSSGTSSGLGCGSCSLDLRPPRGTAASLWRPVAGRLCQPPLLASQGTPARSRGASRSKCGIQPSSNPVSAPSKLCSPGQVTQPLCASVYSPVGWRVLQRFGRRREHCTGRDGRGLCWGVLGQRGPGLQGRPTGARGTSWSSGRQRGDRVQGGISKRQRSLG